MQLGDPGLELGLLVLWTWNHLVRMAVSEPVLKAHSLLSFLGDS